VIDDREAIVLFQLKEKSTYPRSLRTRTSFTANTTDRLETVVLLRPFKRTPYPRISNLKYYQIRPSRQLSKINPESILLDSTFQDYSGESLNLTFNLIFVISSKFFRFNLSLLNPKPQVYFNSSNKPLTLLLSNYFLFLSESIIKKSIKLL
jgi:hypothetical protein